MAGTRDKLSRDIWTMLPRALVDNPSQAAICQVTTNTRDRSVPLVLWRFPFPKVTLVPGSTRESWLRVRLQDPFSNLLHLASLACAPSGVYERRNIVVRAERQLSAISRGNHFEGHLIQLDHTLQLKFRHLSLPCS